MTFQRSLDESFDAVFCRPLGGWLARRLRHTSVTPNQITLCSALLGMASGALFAMPAAWPAVGAVLFLVMMILDCADGMLAGLTGRGSWQGRVLDGLADFTTAFSVHLGMCIKLSMEGAAVGPYTLHPVVPWLLALAAGASLSWNSGVLDGIKQRLKPESVDRQLDRYRSEVRTLTDRFLFRFLELYSARIDRAAGRPTEDDYAYWRKVQWIGPTHHHLWMIIAGASIYFWPSAYIAYFLFAIVPANVYLLIVMQRARPTEEERLAA